LLTDTRKNQNSTERLGNCISDTSLLFIPFHDSSAQHSAVVFYFIHLSNLLCLLTNDLETDTVVRASGICLSCSSDLSAVFYKQALRIPRCILSLLPPARNGILANENIVHLLDLPNAVAGETSPLENPYTLIVSFN
jgi:hypothetical protein